MNLLIDGRVLRHKYTTGVQRYARGIINALKKVNFNFDIACPNTQNRPLQHFWEHLLLPIKSKNYDILFCPGNIAPLWKYKKTKLVTTIHGLAYLSHPEAYTKSFRLYYRYFMPAILRKSDAVITVSNSEKQILLDKYPWVENKLNVIQNGIDDIFLKQKVVLNKKNYILYIGSLNPLKNFSRLIEAFSKIAAKIPHRLIIAGVKPQIFHKTDIKHHEKIEYLNPKNDQELVDLYLNAALFVFPSLYEASPFPPLEAMACGCPVIASNIPSIIERCGDAAIYCDPNSTDDIATKMIKLLNDKILSEEYIKKGLERVKIYSWENAARDTIRIFNNL